MAPSPYRKVTVIIEGDATGGPFKNEVVYEYPFDLKFEQKRYSLVAGDPVEAVRFTLEINKLLNFAPSADVESVIKEK